MKDRFNICMNCPVCDSVENTILYTINSEDSVQHLLKKCDERFLTTKNLVRTFWKGDVCSLAMCKNCGLIFAFPFIAGDSEYYNIIYKDNSSYEAWKWEYEKTYNELLKIPNKNLKLLEIGAGTGRFVKKISENIISKDNIHCTEYSNFGKTEIEKLGIKCYSLDICENDFINSNNKYDIICLFQVLEHLDNLDNFFTNLNLISNNSTSLFIGVPNNIQRKFYEDVGIILDIPPVHVTRWNFESMNFIANKYNWKILNHSSEPQSVLLNIEQYIKIYFEKRISIFNKIDQISNSFLRKTIKLIIYIYIFFRKLQFIPKLFTKNLGLTQWFHLKKINFL